MNLRHLGLHEQVHELQARQHHHGDGGLGGFGDSGSGGQGGFDGSGSGGGDGGGDGSGGGGGGGTATFMSIVFETATPTFQGPVAGFSTQFGPAALQTFPTQAQASQPQETFEPQPTQVQPQPTYQEPTTHAQTNHAHPSPTPQQHHSTFQNTPNAASATSANFASPTFQSYEPTANGALSTASATAAPSASASSSSGPSAGAKAGIAIGVLLGIGALAGLAFVAFRAYRNKKEAREEEKMNPFGDSANMPPPPSMTSTTSTKVTRGITPPPVPPMADFPRPSTANTTNGPFSNAHAIPSTTGPFSNAHAIPSTTSVPHPEPPVNPFGEHAQIGSQTSFNGSIPIGDETHGGVSPISHDSDKEIIGAAIGGGAAGAAIGAAMGGTERDHAPLPLELDGSRPVPPFAAMPASPSPSQYSFTSTAPTVAGAAAGGAAGAAAGAAAGGAAASNVYRVQLDFHSSMHDEMDLRQGELVRMLHEYDDGWALCVKFDKSARGVCPRTCLGQKPLQPRGPRGGPRGPGPRGPPPPRTASPAPSNGPRGPPGPPGRTASPAPSAGPRMNGPPSRTASPAPPMGGAMPGSRSASPAPSAGGPQLNPNLANWPAKPINASTITPNLSNWPAQPVNFKTGGDMVQRSMSPGPYGGGPQQHNGGPQSMGPVKRRSQSVGNVTLGPGAPGPMPGPTPRPLDTSGEFQLPIMGAQSPGSVSRKPLPGQF